MQRACALHWFTVQFALFTTVNVHLLGVMSYNWSMTPKMCTLTVGANLSLQCKCTVNSLVLQQHKQTAGGEAHFNGIPIGIPLKWGISNSWQLCCQL